MGTDHRKSDSDAQEQIRVLIIAPTLDRLVGGQSIQAARLRRHLNEGQAVTAEIQSIVPARFGKLQDIKYLRTFLTTLQYLFDITFRIPKHDIVHIFSAANLGFLLSTTPAVLYARLWRKPIILNYRSGQLDDHYRDWGWLLPKVFKHVDVIVTPSDYLVDVFRKYGEKAKCIFNIIDLESFRYRRRTTLKPVFLSNRLLEELYNIPCILKAFAIIQERYPEASLAIAAEGDQRPMLEDLVKTLGLRNVKFLGKISQQDMADLYDEVDIYLNSPNTDNMPGSLLECYACGLPIVTTSAGGIPYICDDGETGLMVDIDDHEGMADAALRLLEDEVLVRHLTDNGRNYVKRFSWDQIGDQWVRQYHELLGRDSPSSDSYPQGADADAPPKNVGSNP